MRVKKQRQLDCCEVYLEHRKALDALRVERPFIYWTICAQFHSLMYRLGVKR
jgi:hypothetical protein